MIYVVVSIISGISVLYLTKKVKDKKKLYQYILALFIIWITFVVALLSFFN